MRQTTCEACQASVPMGEAFSVGEKLLCQKCTDQFVAEHGVTHKQGDMERLVDPTICVHCGADGGSTDWPTIANLPACTKCDNFFRNRPYPGWLKASFAVFLLLAVAAFVYNMRFFLAYIEMVKGNRELERQNFEQGVAHLASAAARVPEIPELAIVPNLFKAGQLVRDEKYDEAMALINKTRVSAHPETREMFAELELRAKMGSAFDRKDYDTVFELSQQELKLHPDEAQALASVASAYACKYAITGDPQFRDQALQYLDQAKQRAGPDLSELKEFEERLRYRLQSREIISAKQFKERFPNGWKPESST